MIVFFFPCFKHKELRKDMLKRVKLKPKDPFKLLACHSFSDEYPVS